MVVFSYYGMFLWFPSVMVMKGFGLIKSFGYVLIMTLAQLPGYFTAAWLIERAGRKFVLATYLLGTAASALVFGNAETLPMLLFQRCIVIILQFRCLGCFVCIFTRAISDCNPCNRIRNGGCSWTYWWYFRTATRRFMLAAGTGFGLRFSEFSAEQLLSVF